MKDNLQNKSQAQLLGIIEGNLMSVLSFVDMPDYQKQWVKTALTATQLIGYKQ
tara:strand:+ start:355 stop:513 length:159 start_codon:yes stop_codon:yes gene_type:complete